MPEPGLALLRLAQGRVDAAAAAIRRAVDQANGAAGGSKPEARPRPSGKDRVARSKVLPACVEIMLAAGDVAAARAAAEELWELTAEADLPLLRGIAASAQGAVLLAEGDARAALDALRAACREFEELEVPYETAGARVLVGLAYRTLGDEDGATMELAVARRVFERLGAAPDLARLDALSGRPAHAADGLTAREVQVLALVAKGKSNKEIAAELVISDRTVARHMSSIFTKLGVSTRTAASAYAFQRGLV
jgi:DNA-binding NarL/FixJ family response regulator